MTPYVTDTHASALLIDLQVCQRLMGKDGCSESQVRRNLLKLAPQGVYKDEDTDRWIIPRDCWQAVFGYGEIGPGFFDAEGNFQHAVILLQNNTLVPPDAALIEKKLEEAAARDRQMTVTCQSLTEENLKNTQKIEEFKKQVDQLHAVIEEWKNRHAVTVHQLEVAQTLLNSFKQSGGVIHDMADLQAMQDELDKHSQWIVNLNRRLAVLEDQAAKPDEPEPDDDIDDGDEDEAEDGETLETTAYERHLQVVPPVGKKSLFSWVSKPQR